MSGAPKGEALPRAEEVARRRRHKEYDMAHKNYLFTSESVTEGHPDKMCDQISDAIVDAIFAKEAKLQQQGYVDADGTPANVDNVRCAIETFTTTGTVVVMGEVRTEAYVDVQKIVRDTV